MYSLYHWGMAVASMWNLIKLCDLNLFHADDWHSSVN